ncbi:MAG TPA: cytochrome c peroxidase [Methylovirgula sp.]|nr:cytochrome c peroxidase [Methylovirgula sp.]
MFWKIGGIIVSAILIFSVALVANEQLRLASLRKDYVRPAEIPYPDDDPYSIAKVKLGKTLFFDPILSATGTTSCATCHRPDRSWEDGLALAVGDNRQALKLKTPTLIDVAWLDRLGWTGRFHSLEQITFAPIVSSSNMNMSEKDVVARLSSIPDYVRGFSAAFDDGAITRAHIEEAIATYERSILSTDAPFDRWINGDENAIDASAKRGFLIFNGKGRCNECHSGWAFTDGSFHDIGVAKDQDMGRGQLFPTSVKLRHAFKTPTLRDVALRAPYMHDGSVPTLEAVIDLYDKGGIARPSRAEVIRPLGLSAGEKADLLAFLKTLTGAPQPIAVPVPPR